MNKDMISLYGQIQERWLLNVDGLTGSEIRAAGCMVKNKIAKDLRTPKYKQRVIKNKKRDQNKKRFKLFELLERHK